VHASAKGMMLESGHLVSDAVIDRVRQLFSPSSMHMASAVQPAQGGLLTERAVWGQGFGSWSKHDGNGNAASTHGTTSGLIVGTDALIDNRYRIGLAVGYSQSTLNVEQRKSLADSADYHIAVYGGTRLGAIGLRFGTAYSWHDIETRRTIVFPGFSDVEKAHYNANLVQIFGEGGYSAVFGQLEIEPFARMEAVNLNTDEYSESAGPAALHALNDDSKAAFLTLGAHAARPILFSNDWLIITHATLGWHHTFGDALPVSIFSAGGSSEFSIAGVPIAKDALIVETGLEFAVADDVNLNILYSGQFASRSTNNAIRGQMALQF
jgi:outer membrane autotransporter protein